MGKKFKMAGLVKRHTQGCGPVELWREEGGGYDGLGEWVPGEKTSREICAALTPYTEQQVVQSGGTISRKDRKLYSREDLGEDLTRVKICAEGEVYTLNGARGTGRYADVHVYGLTWVEHLSQNAESEVTGGVTTAYDAGNPAGRA